MIYLIQLDIFVSYSPTTTSDVLLDFSTIACDIISRLMSTYCLDLFGSSLRNYSKDSVNDMFVAKRKVVRRIWKLPSMTHCNLQPTLNCSPPIEIALRNGVRNLFTHV